MKAKGITNFVYKEIHIKKLPLSNNKIQFMKKSSIVALLVSGLIMIGCNQELDKKYEEATLEMEALEDQLEETSSAIEEETEDMQHDIDSLLEGI